MSPSIATIDAPDGAGSFHAMVAYPEEKHGPAVILCYGENEPEDLIRETVESYSEEGYIAIAPDLSWRSKQGSPPSRSDRGAIHETRRRTRLDASKALEDLDATVGFLRSMPECDGGVGVLGFGDGARIAFEAAARLEIDAAVSYYGIDIENLVDPATDLRCPVVLHFGDEDEYVSETAFNSIRSSLGEISNVEIHTYTGARHGFAEPGNAAFDKAFALLAHDRSIALFRRTIGPQFDLSALWEHHRACEFTIRDTEQTMATMVDSPYVNHIPTMTGGVGYEQLARFYKYHFIPKNSTTRNSTLISRTIGATQIVDEILVRFVHDREMDWMLPGIEPTGRAVEVALVAIIKFRGGKLYHEHIYWDQASVLAQIGLLDTDGLPVAGVQGARKLADESLPSNTLLPNWPESEGKPIP